MRPSDVPHPPDAGATSPARVRSVLQRLFAAVEHSDVDAYLNATYHPDVTIHESPALPYGGEYRGGPSGVLQHAAAFTSTWAPLRTAAEQGLDAEIHAVPDHGFVHWRLRVAGRGFAFLSHYRFRDGLIVESRMYPFDATAPLAWWRVLRSGSCWAAEQRPTG